MSTITIIVHTYINSDVNYKATFSLFLLYVYT